MYIWRVFVFKFFRNQQEKAIGADIDGLSVSLLELSPESENFRLNAYSRGIFPSQQVALEQRDDLDDSDLDKYGAYLKGLLKKANFSAKNVISAVPASSIITKQLVMDASLNEEEMETQIVLEAEQIIPYPIDEVTFDFEVIGKNESEDKVDVLLVACRKQTVDDHESILCISGLNPTVIDVVTYAMERAYTLIEPTLNLPEDSASVALVNIGESSITLNILRNGQSAYVRSFPFGVRQLADSLCQKLQCSLHEAIEYCLSHRLPSGQTFENMGAEFYVQATRQINRLLEQYYSSKHAPIVDHIVLSGILPEIALLQKKISGVFGVECSIANPFEGMTVAECINSEQLNNIAPALFVACGLAMRMPL